MTWAEIFMSGPAVTLYATGVLFFWNWLKRRQGWDTERWEGLVAMAFNAAEKSGVKTGNAKLDLALKVFAQQYVATYNAEPDVTDLRDAALDLARLAYEHKLSKAL